ncbi:MAG: GNAT family N-acetyltransferase [Bacilli bacterium]|nr:GNAT family N-acetyltransferase [Bacilli bacterium]
MIHVMKLQEQYFNYIKLGTKEYEIRLNDEKRRNIKVGDFLEFQKEPLLEDKMILKVKDLIYYDNFSDLLNDIDNYYLADKDISKNELLNDLEKFYPIAKQNKYGVVAIKLDKSNIVNCTSIKNIDTNNSLFNELRNSYDNFDTWLNKMILNKVDVFYTEGKNKITSILMLKINETDSQQFDFEGNIIKIRTLIVNDKNRGIGSLYLELVDQIAMNNNIDYIYLTVNDNNNELINFIKKHDYQEYKKINNEVVYYKKQ